MNKRLIITSTISIILVSILMINSTYSIFTTSDIDEESNVYTTGNLDITYTIDSNNITFSEKEPINIEDANTVIPYRITVKNEGTVPYMFDLILEDTTSTEVIDYQYIMTKVGYLEPKSLSNCTDNVIKEDIILPAGETVDIDVRVWLSDTLQNTEIDKSFFAKLKVDGIAIYDKNETIDNSILSLVYMKKLFNDNPENNSSYFHDETYLTTIKSVSFVKYIDTTDNVTSWDVSEDSDGSVMAWIMNNETEGYYDLYFGSEKVIFAKDLAYFFTNMTSIDSISFDNLDTSLCTNMHGSFTKTGYDSTLFTLKNLGENFNTRNVTTMYQLFDQAGYNNPSFELNLGEHFDTSNVTDMQGMFRATGYNNPSFTIDLGDNFDTSKVENMNSMFQFTGTSSSIFTLDLREKFDTSNVTDMSFMFNNTGYNATNFTINLGNKFNTSNVTNMKGMFAGMGYNSSIFTLDLGEQFNTSNVTDMSHMFSGSGYSNSKFTLNLGSKFNTENVTNMSAMFFTTGFSSTVFTLDLGENFNTSKVTDMSGMFNHTGYNSTEFTINLGNYFDTSNVTNTKQMFSKIGYANSNLVLDLSTFTFDNITDYEEMFYNSSSTQTIYVSTTAQQSWLIDKGFTNVTSDNVLIKSS